MAKSLEIAICGAGPAGLATALYLTRLGHRPTIFERFAAPQPIGSGLILQPTGQAVLHDLGLFNAIVALGQPIDRLCGIDAASGRTVLDVRYDKLRGHGRGLAVHRAALFKVLHDAVVAIDVPIQTQTEIRALRELPDDRWALVVQGDRQVGAFDLVIDCLGSGSPLKVYSHKPSKARALSFGAIWGTLPWHDKGFEKQALLQRYQAAKVMIGVLPIGRTEVDGPDLAAFFWSLKIADYERLRAGGLDAWKDEVRGHWPDTAPYLDTVAGFETMTLARYAHHTMPVPHGTAVAFVGDSAHSASPQLGQGANMALLDARGLFLALRDHADDLPQALRRYAALRRWHVRLYQALSAMFTPFYQSDSRALPMIRDVFVSSLSRIPPAPQFLAAMVAGSLLSPLKTLELRKPPEF